MVPPTEYFTYPRGKQEGKKVIFVTIENTYVIAHFPIKKLQLCGCRWRCTRGLAIMRLASRHPSLKDRDGNLCDVGWLLSHFFPFWHDSCLCSGFAHVHRNLKSRCSPSPLTTSYLGKCPWNLESFRS